MVPPAPLSEAARRSLGELATTLARSFQALAAGDAGGAVLEQARAALARLADYASLLDMASLQTAALALHGQLTTDPEAPFAPPLQAGADHLLAQLAGIAPGTDIPAGHVAVLGSMPLPAALLSELAAQGIVLHAFASVADVAAAMRSSPARAIVVESEALAALVIALDAVAGEQPAAASVPLIAYGSTHPAQQRASALLHGATAFIDTLDAALLRPVLQGIDAPERAPATALLIDEDAVRRGAVRRWLEAAGIGVDDGDPAQSARDQIAAAQPALAIISTGLDVADAFATAAALRQDANGVPLLLLGNAGNACGRAAAIAAGADDLLLPPLSPRLLLASARAGLARAHAARGGPPRPAAERRGGSLRRGEFLAQLNAALRPPHAPWQVLLSLRLDQAEALSGQLGIGAAYALEQALAQRFASVLDPADAYSLWLEFGFGVLLQRDHREQVVALAEQLCRVVADTPFQVAGADVRLTLSVGIALTPAEGGGRTDSDRWFASAHAAQSIAHRLGGNRFDGVLSREASAAPAERVLIVREWAKEAAKGSNIVIEYQPMLPLHATQAAAYTVVAKLRDYRAPLEGVGRGEYLKPAREAGAMTMIDRVSLFNAFEAVDAQRERGVPTRIHVPVDLVSINAGALRWLEAECRRRREAGGSVVVEFDADALWADPALGTVLQQVRECGLGLALSDASGSLTRIQQWLQFPVDVLRLPHRALQGAEQDRLVTLLAPWHGAGRFLVIDQVAGTEVVARLWHLNIDFVQGDALAASSPRLDLDFDQVGT
jgi:DNA-binding response OmpR family regulator/EAL domain-containing protein (putative c-di-GMP-specific phosphodiesterase class I)